MTTEPTRERVEAYEKALGCERIDAVGFSGCRMHPYPFTADVRQFAWDDAGCPVAVAAARVEAEDPTP